ncbi:MAG: hypothetical protein BM557_09525 [Flavobacterium sp. MedPE-SWcel]|uniref:hypothetical protein n=1 Tax=uncultured Flavobacterium sp. TaxID=165435 RepID=UPI00091C7AD8|nr:hypothetical protein [uncultured Flavobacterium sp.]OIQ16544.1 MAG: hypothetical protein BM557_09525 [Flavobacterium sp. MedPE-SWcel]
MNVTSFNIKIIDTHENDRVLLEERTEKGAPVLFYNGGDDKYQTLLTSELKFNFSVPDVADGKFFHLYTGSDTRYKVTLSDQDDALLWAGHLMPDQYGEPYQNGHLFVNMVATCGTGRLKGKTLPYEYYNKESGVIQLIAECLKLTGLSQVINFAPAILPAAVNYRWDEIYVDGTVYREEEGPRGAFGVLKALPKRKSAYEILELLVKSIGCTVFTWQGEWFVTGINRKHETYGEFVRYTVDGVYVDNRNIARPSHDLFFQEPPYISVVSPWKEVNATWAIDENGDLLPEYIIEEDPDKWHIGTGNAILDAGTHGVATEAPIKHWQKNGSISAGVGSREGKYLLDFTNGLDLIVLQSPIGPYNLKLAKSYGIGAAATGETAAGTLTNFINLQNPHYLKTSDEYIDRYLTFKVALFANGGSQELIDGESLQDVFRCDMVVNDTMMVSNRPQALGAANFKYEMDYRAGSSEIIEENPLDYNIVNVTPEQTTGKLEKENIELPHNGFFNLKFFAPVFPDPENAEFYGYTFTVLEAEYTAQDEWYDSFVRDIDFTTVYALSYFHGDSIQDLSQKQFRFRRYIPFDGLDNDVTVLTSEVQVGAFTIYKLYISYQDAQVILQNTALLMVQYLGENYYINDLYSGDPSVLWGVYQAANGTWFISMIKVDHASDVFDNIDNFEILFINTGQGLPGQYGWITENNEWRESWKRYGIDEVERHGVCMAKMYHDVQPEPLVKIEGNAYGIVTPMEFLRFNWREMRDFIPLRLAINFTTGHTQITALEAKIENITDYVNR